VFLFALSSLISPLRLLKECASYKQEVRDNTATLDTMIREGRDFYDVKKFREVLGESEMMVPDSESRLQQAVTELQRFLSENESVDPSFSEGEWYNAAQQILDECTNIAATATPAGHNDDNWQQGRIQTEVVDLAPDEVF